MKRFLKVYHQISKINGLTSVYSVFSNDVLMKSISLNAILLTTELISSKVIRNLIFKYILSSYSSCLMRILYKKQAKKYMAILLLL